jgi:hypothetical protein
MQLKSMLAKASSIALTTDACALLTGDSYVAVTAHWIDEHWNLLSAVLGCSACNGTIRLLLPRPVAASGRASHVHLTAPHLSYPLMQYLIPPSRSLR